VSAGCVHHPQFALKIKHDCQYWKFFSLAAAMTVILAMAVTANQGPIRAGRKICPMGRKRLPETPEHNILWFISASGHNIGCM